MLLIGLIVACYSCIEIGDTNSGNKGMIVHAFDNDVYLGVANLSNQSFKNLKITGSLHADNIIVTQSAKIMGDAVVIDSAINELFILGKAKLNNLKVTKKTKIIGKAKFNGGTYDELVLQGAKFELSDLVAGSITIKGDDSGSKAAKKSKLILTNCQISGDVICKMPNCDLVIDQNTRVMGKILGFN